MNLIARLLQPQRLDNESQKNYRQRREEAQSFTDSVLGGSLIEPHRHRAPAFKRVRRADIKAVGIRQYKRMSRQLAAARAFQ